MKIIRMIWADRGCRRALVALGLLYGTALFAPFFAPYHYAEDNALYSYAPPTRLHVVDFYQSYCGLFVYGQHYTSDAYYRRIYHEDKSAICPIHFFGRGFEYKVLGFWKSDRHLFAVEGGRFYLLGADLKGRDIFSRIVYGLRASLFISLFAAVLTFGIGLIVGGISGYCGGAVDNLLMRLCEMMMLAPAFYLLLALRSSFPPGMSSTQIYLLITVILALIGWAGVARVIRGMALSLKENDFVAAARVSGVNDLAIIVRHILPHTFSYAVTAAVLSIPGYILGEAGLSMLGLGIQEPEASLGNLLSAAMGIVNVRLYPWILTPGIFIMLAVLSFNALGEGLRDALDPKRRNV